MPLCCFQLPCERVTDPSSMPARQWRTVAYARCGSGWSEPRVGSWQSYLVSKAQTVRVARPGAIPRTGSRPCAAVTFKAQGHRNRCRNLIRNQGKPNNRYRPNSTATIGARPAFSFSITLARCSASSSRTSVRNRPHLTADLEAVATSYQQALSQIPDLAPGLLQATAQDRLRRVAGDPAVTRATPASPAVPCRHNSGAMPAPVQSPASDGKRAACAPRTASRSSLAPKRRVRCLPWLWHRC